MFLHLFYNIQNNIFRLYVRLLLLFATWTLFLSTRIGISSSDCYVSTSANYLRNIVTEIFLPVTFWNTNKAFTTTVKKSSKVNFSYHFTVFFKGLLYVLIWSERSIEIFPVLYSTIHFWFAIKPFFRFYIYHFARIFRRKGQNIFLYFHFKIVIPLLFSLPNFSVF